MYNNKEYIIIEDTQQYARTEYNTQLAEDKFQQNLRSHCWGVFNEKIIKDVSREVRRISFLFFQYIMELREIGVSHTACKDEFRQNIRFDKIFDRIAGVNFCLFDTPEYRLVISLPPCAKRARRRRR